MKASGAIAFESRIYCSGIITEFLSRPLIVRPEIRRESISFEIRHYEEKIEILGITLPYKIFPVTSISDETIISSSTDRDGDVWVMTLHRYLGSFSLTRTYNRNLPGIGGDIKMAVHDAKCNKVERLL